MKMSVYLSLSKKHARSCTQTRLFQLQTHTTTLTRFNYGGTLYNNLKLGLIKDETQGVCDKNSWSLQMRN